MQAGLANGRVISVNVSQVRTVDYHGEAIATAIFKKPVTGRVAVRGIFVEGDDQADREGHGGPTRAVYAYATEDYRWWEAELGRPLAPGIFGENLTLEGIDVSGARVGEVFRAGSVTLKVMSPRVPCSKLAMAMDDPQFVKRFAAALRPGAYCAIVEAGDVAAGDEATVLSRPAHDLSLAEFAKIYFFERARIRELLNDDVPEYWRDWALARLERAGEASAS